MKPTATSAAITMIAMRTNPATTASPPSTIPAIASPRPAVPFALVLQSLRHLRATQASVVGMTEPVIASLIAFVLLGEILTPLQILGGAVVLAGVFLAETSR